ncbi:MAG TPA: DedA family protein [Gemmatimonadaceae bacterium]|nr:DedA family protein [Gemmatimonadaceae bacterium]
MLEQVLEWLTGLPPIALYLALALVAAVENIFPPLPADTVVAFGAFLAARGEATPVGTLLATWIGNVSGAMFVYAVARRFGAEWLSHRLKRFGGADRKEKLLGMYEKRGMVALFLSRFLPGIRALVPPVAGAARMPPFRVGLIIGVASAIWYGAITWLAYRVGSDWDALQERIVGLSRTTAVAAGVVVAIGLAIWFVRHKRGGNGE